MSQSENNPEAKTPAKKLSKKKKTILLVAAWIVLLGVSAGLAFLLKPAPEVVHTNAVIDAYKFTEKESEKTIETVDDLDYYGSYVPNPLTFNRQESGGFYLISGLKDKTVEEKINNKILEVNNKFCSDGSQHCRSSMRIGANYHNLLSLILSKYVDNGDIYEYLTFDLNTGGQLSFDDLFSPGVNLKQLLFKSFYDSLSSNIQFEKLHALNRLSAERHAPDPSQCDAQYCPRPGETYDSLRALIADYDDQLNNMEEIAANALDSYLAGEKKFYLNSYGPAFILGNGDVVKMELGDNMRYAIYLKKYRSENSIFENDPIASISNPFYTQNPVIGVNFIHEETDSYIFDYAEDSYDEEFSLADVQSIREYIKNKGLSIPSDNQKFRHILGGGGIMTMWGIREVTANFHIYETDKSYYDSVYRKAIIDGKSQNAWLSNVQPARMGRYDQDKVTELGYQDITVIITKSGKILDDINDVLVNPPDSEIGWQEYLSQIAYNEVCSRSWNQKCYTDEEKQSQELLYDISASGIVIKLKEDSESTPIYMYDIDFSNILPQYINQDIYTTK